MSIILKMQKEKKKAFDRLNTYLKFKEKNKI